jgi:predicted methyltransferase
MSSPHTLLASLLIVAGCGAATRSAPAASTPVASTPVAATIAPPTDRVASILAAVAASDRDAADLALDEGRHPAELLGFFGVAPGQRVAELFAGGGYTTELLARVVGEHGVVYAHNTTAILDKFARKPWAARAAKPVMAHVVAVERELAEPLPAEAHDLDLVLMVLTYHDTVWLGVDRAAMNRAVFQALRRGGSYGIVDHRAAAGHGVADAQTLHRIDEATVIAEVTAAGFRLDGHSDALAAADDGHDWSASPGAAGERRGHSDRFVLRFVKP